MRSKLRVIAVVALFFHGSKAPAVIAQIAPPEYPVLFVHGLNGSDSSWVDAVRFLEFAGWGTPFTLHADLNVNPQTTYLGDDIVYSDAVRFGTYEPFTQDERGTRLFLTNFKANYDPADQVLWPHVLLHEPGQSDSNESSIVKQGAILGQYIRRILEITGAEKVILFGHSMGGLAIREYLQRREGGVPMWWVRPNDLDAGHKVARAITYGTPHQGSNMTSAGLIEWYKGIDLHSEAVRDLRWEYALSGQGRYLFGGSETGSGYYHNMDVNCDGDEDDVVAGINEGDHQSRLAYDNPAMPLPRNVEYVWIVGNWTGSGDFIVDFDRQLLLKQQVDGSVTIEPAGSVQWFVTDEVHWNQPEDVETIVQAITLPFSTGTDPSSPLPRVALRQNFPNPFTESTSIPIDVHRDGHVRLAVYDVLGRIVAILKDEHISSGSYFITWNGTRSDGSPLPNGPYFYRLEVDDTLVGVGTAILRK